MRNRVLVKADLMEDLYLVYEGSWTFGFVFCGKPPTPGAAA